MVVCQVYLSCFMAPGVQVRLGSESQIVIMLLLSHSGQGRLFVTVVPMKVVMMGWMGSS